MSNQQYFQYEANVILDNGRAAILISGNKPLETELRYVLSKLGVSTSKLPKTGRTVVNNIDIVSITPWNENSLACNRDFLGRRMILNFTSVTEFKSAGFCTTAVIKDLVETNENRKKFHGRTFKEEAYIMQAAYEALSESDKQLVSAYLVTGQGVQL